VPIGWHPLACYHPKADSKLIALCWLPRFTFTLNYFRSAPYRAIRHTNCLLNPRERNLADSGSDLQ
jgi:hypothetical protein